MVPPDNDHHADISKLMLRLPQEQNLLQERMSPSPSPKPAKPHGSRFEDPMMTWRCSSQSDGALTSAPPSPSTSGKLAAMRHTDSLLDSAPASPRSSLQSPLSASMRVSPPTVGSPARSEAPSFFTKLRLQSRKSLKFFDVSDGGSTSSAPQCSKSIDGSQALGGSDDLDMLMHIRHSSYTQAGSPLLNMTAAGPLSPSAPFAQPAASLSPADAAGTAAARDLRRTFTRVEESYGDGHSDTFRRLSRGLTSRSLGMHAHTFRHVGAGNSAQAAAEGGLQSQTHVALQQLLGEHGSGKRMSASTDFQPRTSMPGSTRTSREFGGTNYSAFSYSARQPPSQGRTSLYALPPNDEEEVEQEQRSSVPSLAAAATLQQRRARAAGRSLEGLPVPNSLKLPLGGLEVGGPGTEARRRSSCEDDDAF